MALFERSVLGLDLGSQGLKAVELKVSPRVLSAGQFRVHPRVDSATPLSEHIQRFVSMHSLPLDQVACALPADQLSTRRLEFPFSDARRLNQAIPFEIEAETPFSLDEIFLDWNLLAGDRTHGVAAVTLTRRSHVREALATLRDAGVDPHVLEAEGLVLANLAPIFGLEGTQLIADIGHEKTTFCALLDGKPVLARSIAVAGRAMTDAIASEHGLSLEAAEQQKIEGGALSRSGRSGAGGSPGVAAIVDRIAREALRTLEAAEARHGDGPIAREAHFTLVGGSARLEHLDEVLAKRTGLETSRLRMPADSPHADLVEGIDPTLFAPALALALRFSGESATAMNFRQGEYAFRQDYSQLFGRELKPTAILAAALVALLLASSIMTIGLQSARQSGQEKAAARLYQEAFPNVGRVPDNPSAEMGRQLRDAEARADFLGLYSGDRSALELLAELSQTIPIDLDVRVTEVNIDRNVIRLDVDADGFEDADRLTQVLSATTPFAGARVAGSVKTDRRSGGVSFNVSIPLQSSGDDV